MPYIRYVGSGYSEHWEMIKNQSFTVPTSSTWRDRNNPKTRSCKLSNQECENV